MTEIDRRTFIALGGMGLVAAACGSDDSVGDAGDDAPSAGDATSTSAGEPVLALGVQFPDGLVGSPAFVAGIEQRAPFAIADANGLLGKDAPEQIEIEVTAPEGAPELITLDRHNEGIGVAYYPWIWTPEQAGRWQVAMGEVGQPRPFIVGEPGDNNLIQIGDELRIVDTPTVDDPAGVDPLCTRPAGLCEFHKRSLTEVAAKPGPIALLLATPGFCQTAICGPVLDMLIDEVANRDTVTAVHSEIYVKPEEDLDAGSTGTPELVPIVGEYGLEYEPSLVVTDADHVVVARLDFTYDRVELASALDLVA